MTLRKQAAVAILSVALLSAGGGVWLAARADDPAQPPPAPPPVPVTASLARGDSVPIVRTGLGTVQGSNTVTIRPRVDGTIVKIGFTEGEDVKAGDLLAQIDPRPLQAAVDQAIAQRAKDEAQLGDARAQLARFANLAQRDFATRASVDTQAALVHQLEAAIKGDQAAIESAQVQLGYATITAPITGRTGLRLIDQGNLVRAADANSAIVVITQVRPIAVIFSLAADQLPDVNKARALGPVAVEAWDQADQTKLDDGTLTLVDNQIDQTTGTMKIKATFPNVKDALWPGQFVSTHLLLETRRNAVTVPAQAVQRGQTGTFAWIIKPDNGVEMRPIKVAQIKDGVALIETGIAAGESVVVDGQYKLRPTSKVTATMLAVTPTNLAAAAAAGGTPK